MVFYGNLRGSARRDRLIFSTTKMARRAIGVSAIVFNMLRAIWNRSDMVCGVSIAVVVSILLFFGCKNGSVRGDRLIFRTT